MEAEASRPIGLGSVNASGGMDIAAQRGAAEASSLTVGLQRFVRLERYFRRGDVEGVFGGEDACGDMGGIGGTGGIRHIGGTGYRTGAVREEFGERRGDGASRRLDMHIDLSDVAAHGRCTVYRVQLHLSPQGLLVDLGLDALGGRASKRG